MNKIYQEIKDEMKYLALSIHANKIERKPSLRKSNRAGWEIQYDINKLKYEFRHKHIARCELRGKTRDQIEKPADINPANEIYINKIKAEWIKKIEEIKTLCDNSARSDNSPTSCAVGSCSC